LLAIWGFEVVSKEGQKRHILGVGNWWENALLHRAKAFSEKGGADRRL